MKKTLVLYYSYTGNNKYVAERIGKELRCDIEEIKPKKKMRIFFGIILSILFRSKAAIFPLFHDPAEYDFCIICAPVWVGQIPSPIRELLSRYKNNMKSAAYITVCGGADEKNNEIKEKSYSLAFKEFKRFLGKQIDFATAIPVSLTTPSSDAEDASKTIEVRLHDQNFKGEIKKRFDACIRQLKG